MKKLILYYLLSIVLFLALSAQELYAQQHMTSEYGKVEFELTCSEEAGKIFETGLALLHHMMYEQAKEEFETVAEKDPECAMAQWGVAMSFIHPLWGERPSDKQLEKGQEAISKVTSLNTSEREKGYIKAVEKFYDNWKNSSYAEQLIAFEEGYKKLYESYQTDIDAGAFYALGQLATASKEDKTFAQQQQAGSLLEELHEQAPEHPGLFHYTIHAYDNPALADKAVEVAKAYDKVAPEVPHALHMPSHIFVRQGIWEDVIDWNIRSEEAALHHSVDGKMSIHYPHAIDYQVYAYLQRGEDEKAREAMEKLNKMDNLEQDLGTAYAVAAVNTRYTLEREDWEEAANIPEEPHEMYSLANYPAAESMVYYARGIGAARAGHLDKAQLAIEALDQVYDKLITEDEYWATLTDAQRTSIAAWIEFSNGDQDKAMDLMKKAADKEDSVDKHPVTPGHILPARELYGDMLFELNHPYEALKAYESSLEISANRFRSLYGAGRSADLTGEMGLALLSFEKLVEMTVDVESDRPQIIEVKQFVADSKTDQ